MGKGARNRRDIGDEIFSCLCGGGDALEGGSREGFGGIFGGEGFFAKAKQGIEGVGFGGGGCGLKRCDQFGGFAGEGGDLRGRLGIHGFIAHLDGALEGLFAAIGGKELLSSALLFFFGEREHEGGCGFADLIKLRLGGGRRGGETREGSGGRRGCFGGVERGKGEGGQAALRGECGECGEVAL